MKKLTYEYVKSYFKSQGCMLLSTEYINNRTKLKYICSCGNESTTIWSNFREGRRCNKCGTKRNANKQKHSFEYVNNYFEFQGCTLLSIVYINSGSKLKYVCNCKNKAEISFDNFKNGGRCNKCAIKKRVDKRKYSYKYVKKYFEERCCKLLSEIYVNNYTKLKYKCLCGNISKITFKHFKNEGSRCRKCGTNKRRDKFVKLGKWTLIEDLDNFQKYRRIVVNLSNVNYRRYINEINPKNLLRGRNKYHLDHKFSTLEGFKNNIPPYIISNCNNLEMLSERDNISKNNKCSITKEELFSTIL